jgi:hypothetical protein
VLEKDSRPGTSPRAFGLSRCASSTRGFPGQADGSVEVVRFIDLTGFSHRVGNARCLRKAESYVGQESFFRFKDFVVETMARLGSAVKMARVISLHGQSMISPSAAIARRADEGFKDAGDSDERCRDP